MLFTKATQIDAQLCTTLLHSWENDNKSVPHQQFWCHNDSDNTYVVIDNIGGEFFVECFKNPEAAHAWLRGLGIAEAMELDRFLMKNV